MGSEAKHRSLLAAVEWSVKQLEKPRLQRVEGIKQYVGSHYADGGTDLRTPTNLLEMAATIYVQSLAARAPQVMISTDVDALRPMAKSMELALNQIPGEIDLERTMQDVVLEAIFGIGVVKVGLCSSGIEHAGHDVGEPFVDLVTLDDYFLDMSATTRDAMQFEGNDYWLELDAARAMNQEGGDVEPDDHTIHGEQGERRAQQVSTDEGADTFRERVWMRDIWLPHSRKLRTYGVKSKKLFRVVDWDGPDHGPYHTLRYTNVPGNLLPLAPASLWYDLNELANTLFRKLSKQAMAKKTVATFSGGDEDSVDALKKSKDGEGIRYNGTKPEMLTVGGIDAPTLAFFLQSKDLFSYFAGNLDALGGLGPQTETATQDKMLSAAAGARMERYKTNTIKFAKGLFKTLAWYEWTDPVRERVVGKRIPGTDMVIQSVWSDETRDGDFLDFNLEIDPYSMEEDTPSLRLQKIGQTLERFILPLMPILEQQGASIDVRKLLELVARLSNVDEIRELVVFGEPIQGAPQTGGSPTPSFKPANTTRTYERVNRPGATRAGKDDAMTRILMGGSLQESEASQTGRQIS